MRHVLILLALVVCGVHAADKAPDPAAMQAAMEQMSKTGPEHAALATMAGEWDVQSSMWMDPKAPPMVSSDSATFTVILDGRWVRQDYRGTFMGKPSTGLGMFGYDGYEKKYISMWFDSMMTGSTPMSGTAGADGKSITYSCRMEKCPMTGGPITMRGVLVMESPDKMTFTMYDTPEGQAENKSMEMVYTRKKAK